MLSFTLPSSVGTSISEPSAAVAKGYVLIKEHRRALALKPCVGLHEHCYQQIAEVGPPFTPALPCPRRDMVCPSSMPAGMLMLTLCWRRMLPMPWQVPHGLWMIFAATLALIAARVLLHHTERRALRGFHLTRTLAVGADLGSRARGAACALAVGALLNARYEHFAF